MLIQKRKEAWRCTQKGKEKKGRVRKEGTHRGREGKEAYIKERREKKKGLWHINFIMLNDLFLYKLVFSYSRRLVNQYS